MTALDPSLPRSLGCSCFSTPSSVVARQNHSFIKNTTALQFESAPKLFLLELQEERGPFMATSQLCKGPPPGLPAVPGNLPTTLQPNFYSESTQTNARQEMYENLASTRDGK